MRNLLLATAALVSVAAAPALAWSEPPVSGPLDAACRDEARAKVFTAPNPQGLGPFEHGKQIYLACMAAGRGAEARARPTRG